jgi:hypothetical protein
MPSRRLQVLMLYATGDSAMSKSDKSSLSRRDHSQSEHASAAQPKPGGSDARGPIPAKVASLELPPAVTGTPSSAAPAKSAARPTTTKVSPKPGCY